MRTDNRLQAAVDMHCPDGHRLAVGIRVVPIVSSKNHALGAVEVSDIARRKQWERLNVELKKMAFRNPLTQLVNRRYLDSKLRHALDELVLFGKCFGRPLARSQDFKAVNDNLGHMAGDVVFEHIARTISSRLRVGDTVG